MKAKENFNLLTTRFLSGEMNEMEKDRFLNWVERDENRKNEFETMKNIWDSMSKQTSKPWDSKLAWNHLRGRLEADSLVPVETYSSRPLWRQTYRLAAGVALLAAVAVLIQWLVLPNRHATVGQQYSAVYRSMSVDLADGSRVYLNKGSVISLHKDYPEVRCLNLSGEAYFDVMANPSKPFEITLKHARVEVKGTRFNLKESPDQEKVEIFVESGKVAFGIKGAGEPIMLTEGDFASSNGKTAFKSELQNLNFLSWHSKEFVFVNEPVAAVLAELANAYHATIVLESKDKEELRITSEYKDQSLNAILETICTLYQLKLVESDGSYVLISPE